MDLRVLVLVADDGLAGLVRAQVENLGCPCSVAATYADGEPALAWADAAIVDLVGSGLSDLSRLRVEAPKIRVLAIGTDDADAEAARSAGAEQVLVEPFSIPDLIDAVRALAPKPAVIDLRAGAAAPIDDDAPWWATR
jgi:DNA-binding response OmpR family regulator